jgi:argininosuccinate lyase
MQNKKIWQKTAQSSLDRVSKFTVGRDKEFDVLLAKYDVLGSIAHTEMLATVGLLSASEKDQIHEQLRIILNSIESETFVMDPEMEDIHSQIEWMLIQEIGEIGKKIHSGRSRNDQVAVDIKMYLKQEAKLISNELSQLFEILIQKSEAHKDVLLPGYTHLQVAMPSSFGLWFSAYAESLVDDMEILAGAYAVINKNPLGSGAGYGSSFALNRELTTELLGFKSMHYNSINAQMSRGKAEKFMAFAISAIAATLAKMSVDICLYLNQNFNFISFPDNLTTGSSLMPHKKNPDIFELIRGKCNRLQAVPNEISMMLTNLPSGYHRELQLTKEILFPSIQTLHECIDMLIYTLPQMSVNENILEDPAYNYIFTVEAVNELVVQGIPFRDAYIEIGNQVNEGTFEYKNFKPATHTHAGSMGNLCNDQIVKAFRLVIGKLE